MARHARNDIAVRDFAKHVAKAAKRSHREVVPKRIELWIYSTYQHHVSEESIRKALRGMVDPTGCDVELITGLAAYFEVSPADLGTYADRRVHAVMAMAGDAGVMPPGGPGEQGIPDSWWIADRGLSVAA